jgi:hypothetical protein
MAAWPSLSAGDKVVVDVPGERCIEHEAQVRCWLLLG